MRSPSATSWPGRTVSRISARLRGMLSSRKLRNSCECVVGPVQVFEHEHLRLALGRAQQQLAQRIEGLRPTNQRVQVVHGIIGVGDAEHVEQIRQGGFEPGPDPLHAAFDLRANDARRVLILDAEVPPQQVDQRVKRHGAAERDRAALGPSHAVAERAR